MPVVNFNDRTLADVVHASGFDKDQKNVKALIENVENYVKYRVYVAEKQALIDGFKASGEGWNGEYPHEGSSDDDIWADLKHRL